MPRTAAKITQADIARVVRAVVSAGMRVGRVEIQPSGAVVIHSVDDTNRSSILPERQEGENEWDVELEEQQ